MDKKSAPPNVTTQTLLVFKSPPGGAIDPSGVFGGSPPYNSTEGKADSDTQPRVAKVPSGSVIFGSIGPLVDMAWPAITPFVSAAGNPTWTYPGFVPAGFRPSSTQARVISTINNSVLTVGLCTVSTSGDVAFYPDATDLAAPWNTAGGSDGFSGFSMSWAVPLV